MTALIFIFSVIGVGILLVGMNFQAIYNNVTYTIPLKNAKFDVNDGHYDYLPLGHVSGMNSMERFDLLPNGDVLITFGSNSENYRPPSGRLPEFSHTQTFKTNDTFVPVCSGTILQEPYPPGIQAIKYLGPMEIDGETQLVFWHESATLQQEIPCSYPEIIQSSLNLWELREQGVPTGYGHGCKNHYCLQP